MESPQTLCPDCHHWMPLQLSTLTTVRYVCQPCFDRRLARTRPREEDPPPLMPGAPLTSSRA